MRALTESLALRPGVLHDLQGLGQAPWLHVRRGVQGPLEVGPGRLARLQQVRGQGVLTPWQIRSGSHFASLQTSAGGRGLCT